MNKPWIASYPPGVPAEIDPTLYPTVGALLEESFGKYRDREAYICMGKSITFGDIDEMSRTFAAWLQGRGLVQGDRVAIMMPNLLQYPIVVSAVIRAGFIAVNVNPLYTPRELEHQLKDSGSKAIIILENFATTLEQVLERTQVKHIVVTSVGDMLGFPKGLLANYVVRHKRKAVPAYTLSGHIKFKDALSEGRKLQFKKPTVSSNDVAVLQYTGGTTGVSKGAVLRHSTIIAALLASEAWLQPGLKKHPIKGQMKILCALPLYHVYAFITCSLLGMRTGGVNLLIPNPRDMDGTLKTLKDHKIHVWPAVNTLFNAMINHPEFASLDFSELSIVNSGGMAVQEAVANKWFEITKRPIVEGFGLSETTSGCTCTRTDVEKFSGNVGLPLPSVDVAILDDDGHPVPVGERGEICIRGPQVTTGYWQRDEESANSFTSDGYFKTGDIGIMDEGGHLKVVDRKKDMILVSGFNVYPNEVEAVVVMHPGVLECAAVGVPDEKTGEAVKLFVVKKDVNLTESDLMAFCAQQLAGYKKPKHIEFRSDLPKTNVGKILRRELRN